MKKSWLFGLGMCLLAAPHAMAVGSALPSYIIQNGQQLSALEKELKKAPAKSELKAWLQWQMALNAPQINHVTRGLKALDDLQKMKQQIIGQDQISLARGRLLFQKGRFAEAIASYQKVPKTSEYWFESIEEEAWSYIRLGEHAKAAGKMATLLSPVFKTWVGPESFFAANYNALRICDYTTVFNNGKLFKERHSGRIQSLETLVKTGSNEGLESAIQRLLSGELQFQAYAQDAAHLPRFFWRDEFLRRHVSQKKKNSNEIVERLIALAKSELAEYKVVITKLNLIEAEVIQRLYLDESLKGQRPGLASTKSDANTLTFPYDDELWLDEIDSYQAKVKACPQLKEAKL